LLSATRIDSDIMATKTDTLAARQQSILQRLQDHGRVSINDLCSSLGASLATIRRDLNMLESRSLLRRTHGGAVPIGPLFYEPFLRDASFQDRVNRSADEKRRIARAAAELVHPGDTIALSGGTTTTEVIRSLKVLSGITIITNSINVAMELSSRSDIDVIVTGGHLRGNWFTLVGPLATTTANMVFADIMFIGVDGIDIEQGLTCTDSAEADFLRHLARHSKRRVVVADHTKISVTAKWLLCPVAEVDLLITDRAATPASVERFEKRGIAVKLV